MHTYIPSKITAAIVLGAMVLQSGRKGGESFRVLAMLDNLPICNHDLPINAEGKKGAMGCGNR